MKKYLKISLVYLVLTLVSGVFYREMTKWTGFTGVTSLAFTHLHFIVLGCLMFIILGLFNEKYKLDTSKIYKPFLITYNIGLIFMEIMFYVRGLLDIFVKDLPHTTDVIVQSLAGLSHITLGVGFVLLFILLFASIKENKKEISK